MSEAASGGVIDEYISDNYKVTPWLTLIAGLRQSNFIGDITENTLSPRIGVAIQLPRLSWVFRGFYGKFYQPPPLLTASGPLIDYANSKTPHSFLCMASMMRNTSSACRFRSADGCWMRIIFKLASITSWITRAWVNQASTFR